MGLDMYMDRVKKIDGMTLNEIFATDLHRKQGFSNYTEYILSTVDVEGGIEGIGCNMGITRGMTWMFTGSIDWLMCMTVNDELIYRDNAPQNCWRSGHLGIDDIDKEDFLIYPNPAREYTYIDFGGSMSGEMEIYGIAGMLVAKLEYNREALRLDLTDLQPGVYFVRLGNATMKFVKM